MVHAKIMGKVVDLTATASAGFANEAGNCAGCGKRYREGEAVFTNENGDTSASMCCGPAPEEAVDVFDLPTDRQWDGDEEVDLKTFMPRGKSATDLCRSCFQIPSASGVCGCF